MLNTLTYATRNGVDVRFSRRLLAWPVGVPKFGRLAEMTTVDGVELILGYLFILAFLVPIVTFSQPLRMNGVNRAANLLARRVKSRAPMIRDNQYCVRCGVRPEGRPEGMTVRAQKVI
jgi:hypothetical protein